MLYSRSNSTETRFIRLLSRVVGIPIKEVESETLSKTDKALLLESTKSLIFPLLTDDKYGVSGETAISFYISSLAETPINGANVKENAQVLQWIEFIKATVVCYVKQLGDDKKASKFVGLNAVLQKINDALREPWLVGQQMSLVDLYLLNYIVELTKEGFVPVELANIHEWMDVLFENEFVSEGCILISFR